MGIPPLLVGAGDRHESQSGGWRRDVHVGKSEGLSTLPGPALQLTRRTTYMRMLSLAKPARRVKAEGSMHKAPAPNSVRHPAEGFAAGHTEV